MKTTRDIPSAIVFAGLFACLSTLTFGGANLSAQGRESQLNLSWKNVPGARGYIVQVRDVGGKKVLDRKTPKSEIDFLLPPGDYTVRMAAVNKFNKPSAWSNWQDIRIRRPVAPEPRSLRPDEIEVGERPTFEISGKGFFRSTEVNLQKGDEIYKFRPEFISTVSLSFALTEKLEAGSYDLVLKNPGGKVTRSRNALRVREKGKPPVKERGTEGVPEATGEPTEEPGFYWKAYVPGLPEAGDLTGYIWPGTVAVLAAASGVEYARAETTRRQIVSDPMYPVFQSPSLLVAAAGSDFSTGAALYTVQSVSNLSRQSEEYRDHLQRASLYGGAAVLVYAAHAFRYRLGFSSIPAAAETMIPGLADFQAGQYVAGAAWMGSFLGFTAMAARNYNLANENVRSLENDPLYRIFNEPLLLAGLRISDSTRGDVAIPAYLAGLRHQEIRAEYAANQNRFGLAAGAAATVFLAHYLWKQPRRGEPAAEDSLESGTGMRLDVYPEMNGERAGTRAEIRFELRTP